MENVMTYDGFTPLTESEMLAVDGGDNVAAVFFGSIFIAVSPVAAILCPPAGGALLFTGLGLFGKGSGLY